MRYERKIWLSTAAILLIMAIFYLININWASTSYTDFVEYEVIYGNYFQNLTWQTFFAVMALLYWSSNYRPLLQTAVRLNRRGELGKLIIKRTNYLILNFSLLFYLLPFSRLVYLRPTFSQISRFITFWSCQMLLSWLWLLIIIYLVLILYSRWQKNILMLALTVLIVVTTALHYLWPLKQSIFVDTQTTLFLSTSTTMSVVLSTIFSVLIMLSILAYQKSVIKRFVWRWEWFA